ncbi:MAG: glycosyltransferase family 4 protein [Metallibacterium sp.]
MRIAIVTETYPPEINGVALTVQALAEGLAARGHGVEVLRPRQPGEIPATARATSVLLPGMALPRYPGLRLGLPAAGKLRARWRHARPDAVYVATEGPLGDSAVRAARALSIAVATGFHTRFDHYMAHYVSAALEPLARKWLRHFHRRAQAVLVPTRALQAELQTLGLDNVRLLRRTVDTRLFNPARRDAALRAQWCVDAHTPVAIYVGRLAPEKNLALAVRAFQAFAARNPKARYVWVGEGPQRAALAAAHPEFIFAGVQRGEVLASHYASADAFLFPSLSETFGNVVLEAMASGLAVLAYDHAAAHEHVRDGVNGLCVAAGAQEAFVEAAFRLGHDASLRAQLGAAARSSIEALSPESIMTDFETLLATLAHEVRHGQPATA